MNPNDFSSCEAAGAIILESSLTKVDEFFHTSRRLRRIALQNAVGGLAAPAGLTAFGYLPPVVGAITQEIIDVLAIANALRVAIRPRSLSDY